MNSVDFGKLSSYVRSYHISHNHISRNVLANMIIIIISTQFLVFLEHWPMLHIAFWTSVTTIDQWLDTSTFALM